MMDLSEFLHARLDEDEEAARQFDGYDPTRPTDLQKALGITPSVPATWELVPSGEYITVYIEPARVLREVDAKRRIISLHEDGSDSDGGYEDGWFGATSDVLHLLALPYADHPDYDERWRP